MGLYATHQILHLKQSTLRASAEPGSVLLRVCSMCGRSQKVVHQHVQPVCPHLAVAASGSVSVVGSCKELLLTCVLC